MLALGQMLGENDPTDIIRYLLDIGDDAAAKELMQSGPSGQNLPTLSRAFLGTETKYAFLTENTHTKRSKLSAVADPDLSLRSKRVKLSLDSMFVHNYPGLGKHTILLEFKTKNQAPNGQAEELCFAVKGDADDGNLLSLRNLPLFVGLNVGANGITVDFQSVSVSSAGNDALLSALSSPPFELGIKLLNQVQPAMAPFVSIATGAVKHFAEQKKNSTPHIFHLGLDFNGGGSTPGLRYGTYAAIQEHRGAKKIDLDTCEYDPKTARIISNSKPIERNYLIIKIGEFHEE